MFLKTYVFGGFEARNIFRGDHKQPEKRKPIAAKLIAGMLEVSGVQQVITVDIHSPQTEGFFSIPVDCLTARFLFERFVTQFCIMWWLYTRNIFLVKRQTDLEK